LLTAVRLRAALVMEAGVAWAISLENKNGHGA
jgi:hypothetical protein